MNILSQASTAELAQGAAGLDGVAGAVMLRGPETGLVMLRGRIGGAGEPFNLGEATVTRATVRIAGGEIGHAYTLGRDAEKARLCATMDALWQRQDRRHEIEKLVVTPVRERLEQEERERREKVAATRVDFFTMVRGDD